MAVARNISSVVSRNGSSGDIRPADDVPQAFWNIGVRIEDDVVITAEGCEVLTNAAPKTVAAIEELMTLHSS